MSLRNKEERFLLYLHIMKKLHGQIQFFCSFLRIGDTIKNTGIDRVNRLIKIGMTFSLNKT